MEASDPARGVSAGSSLMVPAEGLRRAVRSLMAVIRAERDKPAFFGYEGGHLVIEIVGTAALVPAVGEWAVRVRVPAGSLEYWEEMPWEEEFVHVRVEKGILRVGRRGLGCQPVGDGEPMVDLPAHPTFARLLRLHREGDRRALENAGLAEEVRRARLYLADLVDSGLSGYRLERHGFPEDEVGEFVKELREGK